MKNKFKNNYVFFLSNNNYFNYNNFTNNNIFVIDNGRVVDSGKHDELLLKSDLYKNFYEKQIQK